MSEAATSIDPIRRVTGPAGVRLVLGGDWVIAEAGAIERTMAALPADTGKALVLDLSGIRHIDTSGAWLLRRLAARAIEGGAAVSLEGVSANAERLLQAVDKADQTPPPAPRKPSFATRFLEGLGRRTVETGHDIALWFNILGGVVGGLGRAVLSPRRLRFTAIVNQVEQAGLGAVPIMLLMSFLIGAIIAQQGAFQLSSFGADVLVVDLVGILVLREIGVLLTAIMLAGRSGSAYTAEIGAMKMREEIDALTVIGMRPVEVLVLPRILALVIALPLVTFLADMAALAGGGLVAWLYLDIPPVAYLARLQWAIGDSTFWVGIIKAPFMALIIGIVACAEGFKVAGSTESLGRQTTASVVKAIFMVIVVDGVFAMFFSAIDF